MNQNVLSKEFWVTPNALKGMLAGVGVLAMALCLFTVFSNRYIHEAVRLIGKEAAPSIIHAQNIKAGLASIDNEAANYLIGKPGQNMDALRAYERRRRECVDALTLAAEEVSFGEAERAPLLALLEGFSDYQEELSAAVTLHERGDAAFLAHYRHGTALLHDKLLPLADQLDAANRKELDTIYNARHQSITWRLCGLLLLGGSLIGLLVFAHQYLARKTNTTVNPYLAAGALVTFLFTAYTAYEFLGADSQLQKAKTDAFESIHLLVITKANASDMEGHESRALLDRARGAAHYRSFAELQAGIVKLPSGATWTDISALRAARLDGSLSKVSQAHSFDGEKEALERAVAAFGEYSAIAGKVRALNEEGKYDAAVKLCIGNEPGESNHAFGKFEKAIDEALAINQKAFDEAVERADHYLDGLYWRSPLVAVVVALLALAGIGIRLRLYSAV